MSEFNPNSPFLYILVSLIILFILAQSLFFLFKAWRRAKELAISTALLKRTLVSSAFFTIAPAVSILLGVITLSKFLGLPLPWLRLSVIGALTYELPAATTAAAAVGTSISQTVRDPRVFSNIIWVMTLGIIPGLFYIPFLLKRIQGGIVSLKQKDKKWGETFLTALFLGMISAFLGMIFADITRGLAGWIPVFVMLVSVCLMLVCGFFVKTFQLKWLEDFAIPISMLGAMASSIPITFYLT